MVRYPQQSRKNLLDRDGGSGGGNWTVRLFSNPALVISDSTTLADITECNYSGYAPINSSSWTPADLDANGIAYRDSPLLTFAHDGGVGGQTVRGVYVTWSDGGADELVMIQPFAAGVPMFSDVDSLPVKVRIALRQAA